MIRVLLVDDQELVRTGFRLVLRTASDIEVVGEAADGSEALQLLEGGLAADVCCMDIRMPQMNGIDATRAITAAGYPTLSLIHI